MNGDSNETPTIEQLAANVTLLAKKLDEDHREYESADRERDRCQRKRRETANELKKAKALLNSALLQTLTARLNYTLLQAKMWKQKSEGLEHELEELRAKVSSIDDRHPGDVHFQAVGAKFEGDPVKEQA